MEPYIKKSDIIAEIEKRLKANGAFDEIGDAAWWEDKGMCDAYKSILSILDTLETKEENPEPYFYCKYGGTMPLCSDCKRNHNNSSFKTEEITTWYAPSNGTKHCVDYIQQEQSEMDLEKEIIRVSKNEYFDFTDWKSIARHFFELGLKTQKGE